MLVFSTILAVLMIAAMPSRDSLWTDEAATFHYATLPSLHAFERSLIVERESEALMPVGMLTPWFTVKALGTTEWSMRAINILWASVALIAVLFLSEQLSLPWLPILFAVQPFLWFYANEARPYTLQIAEGAWLLLSLLKFIASEGRAVRWLWCFLAVGLLLCATSLLGVIPFGIELAAGVTVLMRRRIRLSRDAWVAIAVITPLLLLLGGYYLWALHRGAQSSKVWSVSVSNVAFSVYELLGFLGLGPGRMALRGAAKTQSGAVLSSILPYLPGILSLVVMYGCVVYGYVCALKTPKNAPALRIATGIFLGSVVGLYVLAVSAHFPFWGRHLAPILPVVLVIIASSLQSLPFNSKMASGATVLLCLVLLASSVELRFAHRHTKDDYRFAVKRADVALSSGQRVWWFADVWASRYYGLDVTITDTRASRIPIRPDAWVGKYAQIPPPDLIVLSKPDIYDKTGAVREFIQQAGYHETGEVRAFQFFEK